MSSPSPGGKRQVFNRDEKAVPYLPQQRYGLAKWDPEEELRNAKTRFSRRGKRLSVPPQERLDRSLPALPLAATASQIAAERGRPTERVLSIDPLRNSGRETKKKGTWWTYVRDCLPTPATGSMADAAGAEAAVEAELVKAEEGALDHPASRYGSHPSLFLKSTRDPSLSIDR